MPNFRVDVDINEDAPEELEESISQGLDDVRDFLVTKMKKLAPVDTGEFMRSIDSVKINDTKVVLGSSDKPGKVWALEHGHSDQAPNGVFEVTIEREKQNIKRILVENFKS